jgi:hypothetical protein
VLDAPRIPLRPISPQRVLISAGGLAAGLFVGLAIVALLEIRDGRLRTAADVTQVLRLPVVAVIPEMPSLEELLRVQRRRVAISGIAAIVSLAMGYVFWTMELWHFVA